MRCVFGYHVAGGAGVQLVLCISNRGSKGMKLFFKLGIPTKNLGRSLGWVGARTTQTILFSVILPILAVGLSMQVEAAEPGDEVVGLWNTGGSLLKIARTKDGGLEAVVLVLHPSEAVYVEGEPNGPVGAPRRDDLNPDPELRGRLLVGMDLLSGYVFDGKKWEGDIYDPESGKTYSSNMRVGKDGILKMRGYVGVPMFGRTAQFRSAALCDEQTVILLRAGQLPGCD